MERNWAKETEHGPLLRLALPLPRGAIKPMIQAVTPMPSDDQGALIEEDIESNRQPQSQVDAPESLARISIWEFAARSKM